VILRETADLAGGAPPVEAPARARVAVDRWARLPDAIFVGLLVLGVLPAWLVPHVPTQDGANHVESVMGLLRLPGSALLQRYYVPNYGLQPNWLTQMLFAALVRAVSPRVAEKLVLTGYLLLLPLAFRLALPRTARGRWAALGIFPFVHSYPFHMGFWNFGYSLVLYFAALGTWYRARGRLGWRRGAAFSAIILVLFVAHSVSTCALLAALTTILAWRCGLGLVRARGRPRRRDVVLRGWLRRALATYGWALPTLALLAAFFARQPEPLAYRPSLLDYAKHFASLYALVSFDRRELFLTFPVALVVVGAVALVLRARAARRLRPVDGWLAAAAVATALYFGTPDAVADGAQLNDRLALYPFFAALLWLGWTDVPLARLRAAALALTALFVAATALRVAKYEQLEGYLAEYESAAPHVAEGSTILPVTISPFGPRRGGTLDGKKMLSYRVQPFRHVTGYIATDRHGIDLDNSQAKTKHTPLRWRPELNPFTAMETRPFGMESEAPCIELWTYPALGGRIDYVLLWGDEVAAAKDECGSKVLAELAADWERVFVSRPRGLVQLFRPVRPLRGPVPPGPQAE
jgi:hypothetical protein